MENLRRRASASAGSGGVSPARDLLRLVFDVHLSNEPFHRLPDESVTVADVLGVTAVDLLPVASQEPAP